VATPKQKRGLLCQWGVGDHKELQLFGPASFAILALQKPTGCSLGHYVRHVVDEIRRRKSIAW
jgi:hypothetical protein